MTKDDRQERDDEGEVATGGRKANLSAAKEAKNDEFYTQWVDIEREMNAYLEFNADVFRGKTILLPCDDPEWSNFAKFFALHFNDFGIKKLISTSYAADSKPAAIPYQPTLLESQDPKFDETKTRSHGKKFTLTDDDINSDGVINIDDLQWEYLDGDGDFRSTEVTALRDEADIVITNPPFSLFREFIAWLVNGKVKFSIIGNMNAITYKEVFPLLQDDSMWLGTSQPKEFQDGNPSAKSPTKVFGNIKWFSNLEHGRRHEQVQLMTMADNKKFSRHKEIKGIGYRKYDNYNAIEVPFTDAIPDDHEGVMGVPITFLDKYNPEVFEIVNLSRYTKTKGMSKKFVADYYASGQTGQITEGHPDLCYYDINGRPVVPYMRILIRRRKTK